MSEKSSTSIGIGELEKIMLLFKSSNLSKLEWIKEGEILKLEREATNIITETSALKPPKVMQTEERQPSFNQTQAEATEVNEPEQEGLHYVKAPLVGTFYRSSSPDNPPFVEVGQKVKAGKSPCIIEAMKIMNEIESDVSGEVVEIYIENAHPVEYGANLIAIRADK